MSTMRPDWRSRTLERMRALILETDAAIVEERKWGNTPVFEADGIICTGETYQQVVKLTFARGASLPDPKRLFNASLEGGTRRAIDIREGETVNAKAFQALVRAAVRANRAKKKGVKLLSGGNPQIAKGDGEAPVRAYLAALPGWKHAVGTRVDALIVAAVPKVRKAVKWNSPFYGKDAGWFLSMHAFTRYVRLTFFRGAALSPLPPGGSKVPEVRYYDIREGALDEAALTRWVKQAAKLPGWVP